MKFDKCYFIAEIGLNHNGNFEIAKKSIEAAAQSGADAVKFQNFLTEDFLTDKSIMHSYKFNGKTIRRPLFDICKDSEFKREWFPDLIAIAKENKLDFLSTPTSKEGVDDLINNRISWIKNGSDFLTHIPLLRYMASKKVGIIISTGMANKLDIDNAVETILDINPDPSKLVILHCTSSYPTRDEDVNLRKIVSLKERYGLEIGFSDHTIGWESSAQAVTLGAKIIEKHFTIDKNLNGPDHWFSSNPEEFLALTKNVKRAEIRMGKSALMPANSEIKTIDSWTLGVYWAKNKHIGEAVCEEDFLIKKPATEVTPIKIYDLLGKKVLQNCNADSAVRLSDFL